MASITDLLGDKREINRVYDVPDIASYQIAAQREPEMVWLNLPGSGIIYNLEDMRASWESFLNRTLIQHERYYSELCDARTKIFTALNNQHKSLEIAGLENLSFFGKLEFRVEFFAKNLRTVRTTLRSNQRLTQQFIDDYNLALTALDYGKTKLDEFGREKGHDENVLRLLGIIDNLMWAYRDAIGRFKGLKQIYIKRENFFYPQNPFSPKLI